MRFVIGLLVGLILTLTVACSPPPLPEPTFGHAVAESCPARESRDFFLQPRSITHQEATDNWLREDFSFLLSQIGAEPLWCGKRSQDAYRLIWLPVRVPPLVITATKDPHGWTLHSAEYVTLMPTPDPRAAMRIRVNRRGERTVEETVGNEFIHALGRAKFWTAAAFAGGGDDGYVWTIEARRDGRYRVVTRRNARDTAFEDAARVLVRLSGIPLPEEMRRDD